MSHEEDEEPPAYSELPTELLNALENSTANERNEQPVVVVQQPRTNTIPFVPAPPGIDQLLFTLAHEGNADAQARLGQLYYERRDYSNAFAWCSKGARQNNPAAQNRLGSLLQQGFGCNRDLNEAFLCYNRAAHQGHAAAQYNVAVMYKLGIGTTMDYGKAAEWFAKAAQQGDRDAIVQLNTMNIATRVVATSPPSSTLSSASAPCPPGVDADLWARSRGGDSQAVADLLSKNGATLYAWSTSPAQHTNLLAQHILGVLHLSGTGGAPRDVQKALGYFEYAAAEGFPESQCTLGNLYYGGIAGVPKDYLQAVEYFTVAATQNFAAAQTRLGLCYYHGHGVAKNISKATEWWNRAAAQGDKQARINLGMLGPTSAPYNVSKPVPPKPMTSMTYPVASLPEVTNSGRQYDCMISYNWSQRDIVVKIHAFLESKGLTVWRDEEQMTGNTVDRMVDGISSSRIVLAHMSSSYETSQNCQKELDFALSENKTIIPVRLDAGPYPKTKFKTNSDAVAFIDLIGWESNPSKISIALNLLYEQIRRILNISDSSQLSSTASHSAMDSIDSNLLVSAENGDAVSQCKLGALYFKGVGGAPADKKIAFDWFNKAARQGNPDAQTALGCMYMDADGVAEDHAEALYWFTLAADQNNTNALNNLGLMHSKGMGTPVDYEKAFQFYLTAAEGGNALAQNNVGAYFKDGKGGVDRNYDLAFDMFSKSANQGNKMGLYNLACMYRDGLAVDQDKNKARELFQQALTAGHEPAASALESLY